jgi:hypothetical protein
VATVSRELFARELCDFLALGFSAHGIFRRHAVTQFPYWTLTIVRRSSNAPHTLRIDAF